jgi:NAD-specific glutamate dehydrogenase
VLVSRVAGALRVDGVRGRLAAAPLRSRWDRVALTGLEDQIAGSLREVTRVALAAGLRDGPAETLAASVDAHLAGTVGGLAAYREIVGELEATATPDLALLSVVTRSFAKLASGRV